ncbi:MAG: DegT/DnrJ/EryC1/StrS family aminotransferase [Desulfobacteraceae bacterium]|nr:DegT/DnrJ/EryC1/StrS family aminotransferase [Desulfobacteraceae bacterium]
MNVPLLDLKPQLRQLREEIVEAVTKVIDSTQYIQGPEVERLEQNIAKYCGTGFGVGVSSGTDALLISLMSLGIGKGDYVLTTPYSFFATMGVILRTGATPIFADIDNESFNLSPEKVEEVLLADTEKKIKALIPVHLYGQCADMNPLVKIAKKYDLSIIEDAAQAIGAEYPLGEGDKQEWVQAGSMGIAGCFSFFPSKNLGGIGDGGMVVTQDEEFANTLQLMRNHGAYPKYYHSLIGGNFRLDPIQAVVLNIKLKHLDKWHRKRRVNADFYDGLFVKSGLVEKGCIQIPKRVYEQKDGKVEERNSHIFNQYILRVKDRDNLREHLLKNGIGCEIYYPLTLHQQDCLGRDYQKPSLPNAEKAASETIALPIYPELTEPMLEAVVNSIEKFYT